MQIRIFFLSLLAWACSSPANKELKQTVQEPVNIALLHSPGDSTQAQGEPLLHTDPNGNLYLSWIEAVDSATHRLQYARWQDGGWSAPITIAQGSDWFVNWADFPQFAADGKGHYVATFLQKAGPGTYAYDIMLTHSANGTDWTKPKPLNEDGKEAEHGFVSIVPNAEGFLLSWLDGRRTNPMPVGAHDHDHHDAGQMTVRTAQLDTAGKKIWEEEVDERTCDCCQTSIANGPGGPMVVYRDRSDKEIRDIYIAHRAEGQWVSNALHADGWEINGCPVNGPHLEARGSMVAAAWYTEADKKPGVYLKWSADGGKNFGERLAIHDSVPLGRVDLVLVSDSTAVVCWMEGNRILARNVGRDGNMGAIQTIGVNSSKRSAGFPQVSLAGQDLVFAWTNADSRRIVTVRTAHLPR